MGQEAMARMSLEESHAWQKEYCILLYAFFVIIAWDGRRWGACPRGRLAIGIIYVITYYFYVIYLLQRNTHVLVHIIVILYI